MRIPDPGPLGETLFAAKDRAIVSASLVKSPLGGCVESVFTFETQRVAACRPRALLLLTDLLASVLRTAMMRSSMSPSDAENQLRVSSRCQGQIHSHFSIGESYYTVRPGPRFAAPQTRDGVQSGKTCAVQLVCLREFVRKVLVVEDCVEYQGVVADGLAAVDGVVAEEQHVSLT
jgi:hypothetical protein